MILPYSTDAPLYHYPVATVVLIAVNIVVFIPGLTGAIDVEPGYLAFGEGLRPHQWLTSIFLHDGPVHLLGNMIFLWCFGLVVEGKLGWWKYLLIYLAIGVGESAVSQVLMLGSHGGFALGASAAIFGLLGICCVWAPRNEISFVAILFFRGWFFTAPIIMVGIFYLGFDVLELLLTGFSMSGAFAHATGGLAGLGVGFVFLINGWVNCEGFDLVSIWRGKKMRGGASAREGRQKELTEEERAEFRRKKTAEGRKRVHLLLQQEETDAALRLFEKLQTDDPTVAWKQQELLTLISQLQKTQRWERSVALMEQYVNRFTERAVDVRLQLARVLIYDQQRPVRALRVLAKLPDRLAKKEAQTRIQLVREARRLREAGVVELQDEP